jgi:hypothetical protein
MQQMRQVNRCNARSRQKSDPRSSAFIGGFNAVFGAVVIQAGSA